MPTIMNNDNHKSTSNSGSESDDDRSGHRDSDTILLEKLQSLKQMINDADPTSDIFDSSYSYEEFCQDLDVDDVYTRRLLELLIQETASKRQQHIQTSPRGGLVTVTTSSIPSASVSQPRRSNTGVETKEPNYVVHSVYSNGIVRNR